MYIVKSNSPRTDPWGTPCFIVPQVEKKILRIIVILFQPFVFYVLDRI
jgi:hypothetical protein